jgi:hypothetical protein
VTGPDVITRWLETGCLAPSPHNNQPWAVRIAPDGVTLALDERLLPRLGPDRVQFLALGAFIENVSYAAAADGYELTVADVPVVPRRDALITIRFRRRREPGSGQPYSPTVMLDAARRRRTDRGPYEPALPPGAADRLTGMPREPGSSLTLVTDTAGRAAAAGLAADAMRIFFSVPELRRDLAPFVFSGADPPRTTGMPLASLNPSAPATVPGSRWVLDVARAGDEAEAARLRYENAPLHFVVSSRTDTLPGWLAGGRTLQRVLVTAAALGLRHCLAAGPAEVPTLLPGLRRLAGPAAGRPLILGRLGVPRQPGLAIASPRRPVADVVSTPVNPDPEKARFTAALK